jgi:hypothetical protein
MKIKNTLLTALGALLLLTFTANQTRASLFQYEAFLNGPSESPPNSSPGTGFAQVNYDDFAHTLQVEFTFTNLQGTTTASHIHAATALPGTGTAIVATTTPFFAGFPTGVTFGSYSNTLDLTVTNSYNPAFITANGGTTASAEIALVNAIASDKAYLNIHTTVVPGGEIRGFLVPVPEPSTVALLGVGLVALRMRQGKKVPPSGGGRLVAACGGREL